MAQTQSVAEAYYVPAAGSGVAEGNYLAGVTVIQAADPAAYIKNCRDFMAMLNNLPADAGGAESPVRIKTTYTEGALQLENVKADEFHVEYDLTPER